MADDGLRIDKWLWFARLARTRTLCQKLAVSGRVRVNRQKNESAAHQVKVGDVLTIALDAGVRVLRVTGLGSRRGPATEARLLYEDISPSPPSAPVADRPAGTGRPTKRDRRAVERFRAAEPDFNDDFPSGKS